MYNYNRDLYFYRKCTALLVEAQWSYRLALQTSVFHLPLIHLFISFSYFVVMNVKWLTCRNTHSLQPPQLSESCRDARGLSLYCILLLFFIIPSPSRAQVAVMSSRRCGLHPLALWLAVSPAKSPALRCPAHPNKGPTCWRAITSLSKRNSKLICVSRAAADL